MSILHMTSHMTNFEIWLHGNNKILCQRLAYVFACHIKLSQISFLRTEDWELIHEFDWLITFWDKKICRPKILTILFIKFRWK